jgi:hypothetical protein
LRISGLISSLHELFLTDSIVRKGAKYCHVLAQNRPINPFEELRKSIFKNLINKRSPLYYSKIAQMQTEQQLLNQRVVAQPKSIAQQNLLNYSAICQSKSDSTKE